MERWEGKDGHWRVFCWTNHKFPAVFFFNQMISWEAVDDLGLMWMWCTCTLQGTEACLTHTLTISILYTWLNIHLELKSICVWSHAYIRCILGCNHIWCKFWYALPVIISGFSLCWVRKFDIWGTTFEWSCLQEYEERAVISQSGELDRSLHTLGMYPIPKRCAGRSLPKLSYFISRFMCFQI